MLARDGATVVAVDVPAAGEALAGRRQPGRRHRAAARRHRAGRRTPDRRPRPRPARRAGHRGAQRRDHPRQAAGEHRRRAVELRARGEPASRSCGSTRRCSATAALADGGRVVCVSSTSGIAGNRGQTNYARRKAGVIGMVRRRARRGSRERGVTVQRRRSRVHRDRDDRADPAGHPRGRPPDQQPQQGGLPVDVAETVAWLAQPGSAGVNGQVLRVCGQSHGGRVSRCDLALDAAPEPARAVRARRPAAADAAGRCPTSSWCARRARRSAAPRRLRTVCGFRWTDVLPPTYLHVLAFPLQTALMAGRTSRCRCSAWCTSRTGSTLHRPVRVDERWTSPCAPADLRPHPRGQQVDLRQPRRESATGRSGAGAAPTSPQRRRPQRPSPARGRPPRCDGAPDARWQLAGDIGRRYAAVCGDLNPIHLYPLSAKAFGFPRAIAHGMWSLARCVSSCPGGVRRPG